MKNFRLVVEYFKDYKLQLVIGVVGLVLVDGLQIIIPWLIKRAVDLLTQGIDDPAPILKIGGFILLIAIGVGWSRFLWRYFIIGISRKIEERLRNRFYAHLQTLSHTFYDKTPVGDLMAHATNDIEAVRMMCGIALVAGMDAALLMVASLIMMFSINAVLTAYILIPLPIVTMTVLALGPKIHSRFKDVQAGFSMISQKAQETFAGIRVVKSFVQEEPERDNFKLLNQEYVNKNMRLVMVWGVIHPIVWVIAGSATAIILLVGGRRVIDGGMTVGDLVAFNSYLGILVWPMIAVGWVVNLYQRGKASLDRLGQIFDVTPDITDLDDPVDDVIKGRIEFKNLTFAYGDENPVLKDINLTISEAEWVAVMGNTGSSKTTLVNMIARLYDPPEDTVLVDGIDVRKWKLASLRSQVAFVPQQSFLFSDTVQNNIKFGLDLSDSDVKNAARSAHVYEDIKSFSQGFDTVVGERGVTVSGGQKQRMSIARALAVDAPIIILDDALSAVDTETEEFIISELRKRARRRTVVIISHRVSFAQHADRIVFLQDGHIAEEGSHSELIRKRGLYYQVFEHQRMLEEIDKLSEEDEGGGE